MGVELRLSTPSKDLLRDVCQGSFDACFVAVGAHVAKRVDIPSSDATRMLDALAVLRDMELAESAPKFGRRVLVYGGGNTAIDVARTAKRVGSGRRHGCVPSYARTDACA